MNTETEINDVEKELLPFRPVSPEEITTPVGVNNNVNANGRSRMDSSTGTRSYFEDRLAIFAVA